MYNLIYFLQFLYPTEALRPAPELAHRADSSRRSSTAYCQGRIWRHGKNTSNRAALFNPIGEAIENRNRKSEFGGEEGSCAHNVATGSEMINLVEAYKLDLCNKAWIDSSITLFVKEKITPICYEVLQFHCAIDHKPLVQTLITQPETFKDTSHYP